MGKEGWLRVATGGAPFKSEKKRWVVLDGNTMTLYKEEAKKKEADKWGLLGAKVTEAKEKKKKYVQIELAGGKGTQYVAAGEGEHSPWFSALGAATAKRLTVDDFDLLNVIGKGSFGKVMQVRKKSGDDAGAIYAMKVLSKKHIVANNEVEHTRSERNILQRLQHPFLVNLLYSFQTEDKLYFILEFVNGGELFHHLQKDKRFSPERVQLYAAEILLAIECLHSHGVVYRDLKPENLLLTDKGHIKLTDFGLCKEGMTDDEQRTGTFCGTPEYLAPEVLKGQGYTKAVDWWSFASLVYEMLTGLPPFYSQDVQEMYRKIMTEPLKFPDVVADDARELLTDLLKRDITERLTDPEKMKSYAFFKGVDWQALVDGKVPAPFIPEVKDKSDVGQVDEVFLQEQPNLDLDDDDEEGADGADGDFSGFTYQEGGLGGAAGK